jgi:putative nucleotidyltransferase with HDIG domain
MLLPDVIKEKVQSIAQLPALSSIASMALEMVENPKVSTSSLGKLIATDLALTAKVLKIANSPFYGFPKRISTIEFAIIVLGYDTLKEIVISTSLVSSLEEDPDPSFDQKKFREHAITSGTLARQLARDLGYRVSGEVFAGGLLHDMGILVLHRHFSDEYRRIVSIVRETDLTFLEAEESVLGVTHADVGAWLGDRWNLPDHLVEAVALHHTPGRAARNPELVSLIHCADVLAYRVAGMGVEFDKGVEFDHEALNRLQLDDPARLNEYIAGFGSMKQNELAQFTQSDNEPTEGKGTHEG